MQLLLLFI